MRFGNKDKYIETIKDLQYLNLKKAIDHVDLKVKNIVVGSFYNINDSMMDYEKILSFIEQKRQLYKKQKLTIQVLKTLKPKYQKILVLYLYKNKKCADVAIKLNICERSFFRYLQKAIDSYHKNKSVLLRTNPNLL